MTGLPMMTLEEWGADLDRRQREAVASAPFVTTYDEVQFGRWFRARCANQLEPDGERCDGTLTFDAYAKAAPCDTCGAYCGRLVAHWEPR